MGISSTSRPDFGAIKAAIHRKLIQRLNLERVTQMGREAVRPEVAQIVESLAAEENTPMTLQERERLSTEVLDEVFGLGPSSPCCATRASRISWSTPTRAPISSTRSAGAN